MPFKFTEDQFLLINLLLRIAVMAGIISLVLAFRFVVDYLVKGSASRAARVKMILLIASVLIIGVLVRKYGLQAAMDLSLEGTLLAGFLGGVWVGVGVGAAVGVACAFLGETVAFPFYCAVGLLSGLLYTMLRVRGEIWSYSLNPFLIVYTFFEKLFRGRLDRNFVAFAVCLGCALARYNLIARFGIKRIYGHIWYDNYLMAIDLIVLVYTLGIALKMASGTRMEIIMREEEKQLIHARLVTLRSQINPHFLFNTLNSISALIRTDTDKAREMTRRLSSIFRKSLEDCSDTHSLGEELKFVEDYLSIERVRFGEDKLRVASDIAPETLSCEVPTMILQPIAENAIKHGISRETGGGTVRITAKPRGNGVEIVVENDGPHSGQLRLEELLPRGMGLQNVKERLDIYACGEGEFDIEGRSGGGALVRLVIPRIDERRKALEDQGVDCR